MPGLDLFTNQIARVDEEEIEDRCDKLRKKLLAELNSGKKSDTIPRRQFKQHQVHAMADAKIKESERLRKALKISADYEEGDHWRKQEERLKESVRDDQGPNKDQDMDDRRSYSRSRSRSLSHSRSPTRSRSLSRSRSDSDDDLKEEGEIKERRG